MRVMVLALLVALLLPDAVVAKGAVWPQRHVTVYDYSGPEWSPYVQDAVGRFNAMLPKKAPTLLYRAMSGTCQTHGRAITVCVLPESQLDSVALAYTPMRIRGGEMRMASVLIADTLTPDLIVPCHEMMHALGMPQHGAWEDVRPCPYDAGIMRRLYRQAGKRH